MECISCNKETADGVKLNCPECDNAIFRCAKCRGLSIEYSCKCGYKGP